MKIYIFLLSLLVYLFNSGCQEQVIYKDDPRLYNDAYHGHIVGKVLQNDSQAKVIINQEAPIDSTDIDPEDGTFRMENLPIGNYDLVIKAENYRTYTHANVKVEGAGNTYIGEIDLSTVPDLVSYFYPEDLDEIVYNNQFARLSISVTFTRPMDRESVEAAFSTDPPSEGIFFWGQYTTEPRWYYFVDEMNDFVSVVEIKSTDWDKVKERNRRKLVSSHRRQVLKYIEEFVDGENMDVCPGIIYPRSPSTPGLKEMIEHELNDYGLQVVWYDDLD